MKKIKCTLILVVIAAFLACNAFSQAVTTQPRVSQKAAAYQVIGLTKVKIVYSRPAVKDREVWGNLVPYNAPWRAGANENTTITFSNDVKIEGQELAAGTYGLHMIPTETTWEIAFSNNSKAWGSFSYNPAQDALKVKVTPKKSDHYYELLTFTFDEVESESAICALQWADKKIPFKVEVDVHSVVLTSLRDELQTQAGFTWIGWNEAANYCLKNDINHKEALGWATRSAFINPNQNNLMTKAQLTAKMKGDASKENEIIVATLEKDLNTFPVTWKEWQSAANWCAKNNQNEKALEMINRSIAMNASMTNMMTKSQLLATSGKEKDAKKVKEEAIAKGSNAELNNYGYQLLQGGNTAGAVEIFEANVKKNPTDPNAWDSLGEGYFNNGQKEKAIESFKKSLSLNPPANVKANSLKILKQMGVDMNEEKSTP
jgi:tetratricopeptide (TPR) repeat protein